MVSTDEKLDDVAADHDSGDGKSMSKAHFDRGSSQGEGMTRENQK